MAGLRTRREILKLAAVAAGGGVSACYREGEPAEPLSEAESQEFFPQSVASGDPRPHSVVLWVRAIDADRAREDLWLELEVSRDAEFQQRVELSESRLLARASLDHCSSVLLQELEPATTYYYRFRYRSRRGIAQTRTARTRTAPPESADVAVRFAVVSCQDYGGRYYHVHRHIAEQELDFVLHLGDYVYESLGDPAFQDENAARQVRFGQPEQALEIESGTRAFLAAASLDNYRDLYRTYRSDPDLQALHERHPLIAIWDDHEFSDDSYGQHANYGDGRVDELSPERRAAADQAWFEYMPVDYEAREARPLDLRREFPDELRIYRSFLFGRHLELVVTDLRRYRPDHVVPEGAFPGEICVTRAELEAQLGALPPDAVPYVDVETYADGAYQRALSGQAEALGIEAESVTGAISAVWINAALAQLDSRSLPEPIDLEAPDLERGYAFHSLLKTSQFSRVGARYVLAAAPFAAYARKRFEESDGQSENLMGDEQRAWFLDTLRRSTRTFKVWGSEVAFLSRQIDLSRIPLVPPELRTKIQISAEDWDGFPNERAALLAELSEIGDVLILSGDLHCFFAATPYLPERPDEKVVEIVTGAVSSTTWLEGIEGVLASDASLPMEAALLARGIGELLQDRETAPNPHLAFAELGRNGYTSVEVTGSEIAITLSMLAPDVVSTPPEELDTELAQLFQLERFRVPNGAAQLERKLDAGFAVWDSEELSWRAL
jgi:alkaline phosphatase D